VPEKLVELIGQLRELVDRALDWLFQQAMRLGRAALNALGGGTPGAGETAAPTSAPAGPETSGDPERPNVSVPFDLAGEGHTLKFEATADGVELVMASVELPLTTKFRQAHVAIDNFRHYMESVTDPEVRRRYDEELAPKLATFPSTQVAAFKTLYDTYFPRGGSGRLGPDQQRSASARVSPLVTAANQMLAEIRAWAATTGVTDLTEDRIQATLQTKANDMWRQAHQGIRERIDRVIAGFDYEGAPLGYVGSVASGWRGPHKGTTHFDARDFDVDLYVINTAEFDAVVRRTPELNQNGKIFPGRATPRLLVKSREVAAALVSAFPDVARIGSSSIVLRRDAPRG
jgi:hypothetical protein